MSRLLFWIGLIVLVVMALRSKARQSSAGPQAGAARGRPQPEPQAEAMTRCAHCGVYFPVSEAVHLGGLEYCSQAHAGLPAK